MPFAPNFTPTVSFANEETNQVAGRSTVRTVALDTELANASASINALNTNLKALQRDDGKLKDGLIEPYAFSEQANSLIAVAGCTPRGNWAQNTNYAFKDIIQQDNIARICLADHNSGTVFTPTYWLPISGDGTSATNAAAAAASATAAAGSATTAAGSATAAAASATAASGSATAANSSAVNAANSAAAAQSLISSSVTPASQAEAEAGTENTKFMTPLRVAQAIAARAQAIKNLLINGAMAIDQRNSGAAQSFTAGAALAYSVDRWYGYCTGANVTGQRVAGTTPNQFNYRFTGAASVTKIGFSQRIEAANSQHLAGTTATLSVDLANSLLTTVTWTAWYANTADTFGTLASPTRTQIATGTFTVNSTLSRYSTNISIPAAATTGIEIEFSVGSQTSGTWTIGRAQLEAGNSAMSFDYRPVGQELALCQRYYYKYTGSLGIIGYTGDPWNGVVQLKVPMRITPTLDAGATFSVGAGSAGTVAIKSATGVVNSENSVLIHNSASNWTVGAYVSLNNAGFSAEL